MSLDLVHSILSSAWMISPEYIISNTHLIAKLIAGEKVEFYSDQNKKKAEFIADTQLTVASKRLGAVNYFNVSNYTNFGELPEGSIALINIQGVITKQSQFCGPAGTLELMSVIDKAQSSSNVDAIVFNCDSPGGEATNIDTFAKHIKAIQKPTIGVYNGVAASACYYALAGCDEIYATEETDIVGSIGTLITLMDIRGALEKEGIKLHEIYASQSTLKNSYYLEALKGNYKPIKTELLDPYAQAFIDRVKEYRPQINSEEVFTGKTYMSKKAINIGLIDGILLLPDAIIRAKELSENTNQFNQNGKITNMKKGNKKFPALMNVLDIEELVIDAKDNTTTLQYIQLEAIEAALSNVSNLENQLSDSSETITNSANSISAANTAIKALNDQLADLKSENEGLASENEKLGGKPSSSTVVDTEEDVVEDDEDSKTLARINEKTSKKVSSDYGV